VESIAQLSKKAQAEKPGNERRFELLSSAIDMLKDNLGGGTPTTCGTEVTRLREVSDAVRGSPTPPPSADLGNMARVENVSCSCNLNSCTVCLNGGVIEAIRHHFPVMVQRAMIGTQLSTVGEALDMLKRVEMMEGDGSYRGSNPVTHHTDPNPRGDQPSRGGHDRSRPNQYYTRRVQYDRRKNYDRYDYRPGSPTRGKFTSSARNNGPTRGR
jgi:hypothetical protein